MTSLRRHTLVWLSVPPQPEHSDDLAAVTAWHGCGRPFIVCRRRGDRGQLSLGFCLPSPGQRPRRIPCSSHPENVRRASLPPPLDDVVAAGGTCFADLCQAARLAGIDLRVFGSWMWQRLTGEAHATASSDLDVLIPVSGREQAERALLFLASSSKFCPCRIDGELAFPEGDISWSEYASPAGELVIKSLDAIRLIPREGL